MSKNLHAPCINVKSLSLTKCFVIFLLFILFSSFNTVFANTIEWIDFSNEKVSIILNDMCDNVTHGGKIEGDEAGCTGNGFDPSLITNSVSASGGTGNLEYLWMKTTNDPTSQFVTWTIIPGSTAEIYDPIPITQTTHYIRCSRREGCTDYLGESNYVTKTVTCTQSQPCQLLLAINSTNTTCGEANGAATAIPSLGIEPYTYLWSNGGTSATITGLTPGMYTVTVTDADAEACIIVENVEIFSSSSSDITVLLTTTDSNCGSNNGAITAAASGGNSPYSYIWSNGASSATIENLAPGTYTVTATNANGCSDIAAATIIDLGAPQLTLIGNDPSCGEADGSVDAVVSGGSGNYTYSWSNGSSGTGIPNLFGGEYCVTITDSNGCTAAECITLNTASNISLSLNGNDPSCGEADGSVDAVVSGGSGNYTYSWSNGSSGTGIPNLFGGEYCVTVSDASGCTAEECITLTIAIGVNVNLNGTDSSCGETNGSISSTVTGGTGNVTYNWDTGSTENSINNLSNGFYCLTVTDNNSCTAEECIIINSTSSLEVNLSKVDPTCGNSDGAITSEVNGGNGNYSYVWSNGSTSSFINNLLGGEYCVTVSDTDGCQAINCISLNSPQEITVNLNGLDATCGESNGDIASAVSGGNGNYSYVWSSGETSPNINNLSAGEYCVTVSDSDACTAIECITIGASNAIVINLTETDPSCDTADGDIASAVSGGNLNYSYIWNTGQASPNINNLSAGEYCVTVSDTDGCIGQSCVTLEAPSQITIDATAMNTTCGESNGSIDLLVNGGSGNVTYNWDNGAASEDLNNLISGTYCVTVSDQNSCEANICVNVGGSSDLSIIGSTTDNLCAGGSNGGVDITVSGGSGNVTYNWDNSAASEDLSNISAGTYCVTVEDADGCSIAECFTVTDPSNILLVLQRFDPSCNDSNDGSIDLSVSGGTGTYTYAWDNGMTVEDIAALTAGTYCVTVTDANGCTQSDCITLENPNGFTIDLQITNQPSCNGASDAGIDLTVSGAGIGGITYDWDNGMTVEDPMDLSSGTYCVTVTDNNGCTQSDCIDIADPELVTININSTDVTCDGADGSANVEVLSGAGGYTYLWDDALAQTNNIATDLVEGTYTVTVTDINGCTASASTTIIGPNPADCVDKINIGDYVWLDADMDGIQDADEMGVGNVMVKLVTAGNDGVFETFDDVIVATETTQNQTGYYLFEDVMPGTYIIVFMPTSIPNGSMFTGKNEGMDDTIDSDAMPYTGATEPFTLVDGQDDDLSFDAGITYDCLNVISGGSICCDQEVCGAGGDPEPITSDVPASGGIGAIEYLWMKSTTGSPFSTDNPDWMEIPNSNVEEYDPISVFQTTYFIRCARRSGCDDFSGESNIVIVKVVDCNNGNQGRFIGFNINETTDGKVDLSWQTSEEMNDYKFIVETSNDGFNFEVLELVDGKLPTQIKDYLYTHVSPRIGYNYYRIKHLSTNGNTETTDDKMLIMKKEGTRNMMLYPNPFHEVLQIEVLKELEEPAQLQLINSFGQVVRIEQIPIGTQVYQLDMSKHSSGAYYVYIVYDGFKKIQQKIFKLD